MKTTIQTLIAAAALIAMGTTASAGNQHSACSIKSGKRVVILDGKKVIVADCKFTPGVRSVRMVKVR